MLFATPGKDASTVTRFAEDFQAPGGNPDAVTDGTMDMSAAFIKGVRTQFPHAAITFDKFHVMKLLDDAVDAVRRAERKDRPELAGSRYLWLKNPQHLKPTAAAALATLRQADLKTGRARPKPFCKSGTGRRIVA